MRIAFLGDIALVGRYDLRSNPAALQRLEALRELLQGFDLVAANLESPLTWRTSSWVPKSMHLRSDPRNVEVLQHLGVRCVSLANNHMNDFGRRGIDETIAVLEENQIDWFGVDDRTVTVEHGSDRLGLAGFCCLSTNGTGYQSSAGTGIGLLTRDRLARQLTDDRAAGVFSVLSCHWGREHTHYPNPEHIALAHSLATQGPFILHGHHPHVIQGVEKRNGSLVAYSLGNCLFDDLESINGRWRLRQGPDNRKSIVLGVEIRDRAIVRQMTVGFEEDGVSLSDLQALADEYSSGLSSAVDVGRYESSRQTEMDTASDEKFGRRDLRWLLSRLNYHSIGARLSALPRQRRYRAIKEGFWDA